MLSYTGESAKTTKQQSFSSNISKHLIPKLIDTTFPQVSAKDTNQSINQTRTLVLIFPMYFELQAH